MIKNCTLTTRLFDYVPFYEDKVLIKGLSSTSISFDLKQFLALNYGSIPKSITFHAKSENIALVTMEGSIGIFMPLY